MATKSFLTEDEFLQAADHLKAPAFAPTGNEAEIYSLNSLEFSNWLADKLLARLSSHPDWQACDPVVLGSWARGELSPKSDIDLLFCGDEKAVLRLVQSCDLKLRYRMPENPSDWTEGVLPFDVLALFSAVAQTPRAQAKLDEQLANFKSRGTGFRRRLLKAMVVERKARSERFDSISNFLEPNLKFGPGGLRDLEQALVAISLFSDKFDDLKAEASHARAVLLYYKRFFLLIRQKLHLSPGGGDILAAPEQASLAAWLGYQNPRDFMREIQKGVARVSFYADWVVERAAKSSAQIKRAESGRLETVADLFSALAHDSSLLIQSRVRVAADSVFAKPVKTQAERKRRRLLIGKKLTEFIDPRSSESSLVALFRSRLIDHCVPDFRRIVGHVQHDQYHRFSVDAHILQALRQLKRLRAAPQRAGRLKGSVKTLLRREWQILAFACLYHDIAKGRDGDHAELGRAIAERDLAAFGKSPSFTREVSWLVEQHLILSNAAFRENSRSPATWSRLVESGVQGRRLRLLAIFTIVDICATNPEAWTPWKERLLSELVLQLEKPEANSLIRFAQALGRELQKLAVLPQEQITEMVETWAEALDPSLLSSVPAQALSQDLSTILSRTVALKPKSPAPHLEVAEPLVLRIRGGRQTWVRFHAESDRPGLFLEYVGQLARSGLSVRHASIHTDEKLGVYDWFEVKTQKSVVQVRKILKAAARSLGESQPAKLAARVQFDAIEVVGFDEREWVISFRGRDQSGALNEAARALFDEGAQISWAKVHTWGRQIDDVFGVKKNSRVEKSSETLIENLRARLMR